MAKSNELTRLTAYEAVDLLRRGEVSPLEMIDAAEERIRATDMAVNALPTLCLERARDRARQLTHKRPGEGSPWLAGLPISVKDLTDVEGVLTTYGSPIFAANIPKRSDIMVETLEGRGAIVLAKSNTPEFGAGANTFNEVFGKTLNPWNTGKTCGGSSGGAAVSLATGQVWLATGSDLGGSLRTPASFCGVVGLRPSPGRVARGPLTLPFGNLSVNGPMGRDVRDTALMLDAMAGQTPSDPLSMPSPLTPFVDATLNPKKPGRIAFSPDLGITPVDKEVAGICLTAAERIGESGLAVEEATPDLHDAREIFQILRAELFATQRAPLLETHRNQLKPDVIWNIERGLNLSSEDIARARRARGALYYRFLSLFEKYDLLICPTAIVPPFDVDMRCVMELDGHTFENYVDWILITSAITLTACPALSIPCGFTGDGLPVGIQVVGRPYAEAEVLGAATLMEEIFGIAGQLPLDPRDG